MHPHDTAYHALDEQRREEQQANRQHEHPSAEEQQREEQRAFNGTHGSALGPENDDLVSESSAESFPASDPPSWTPERA